MPAARSVILRREIAKHQRARLAACIRAVGERLLACRREAVDAARTLAEAHVRSTEHYETFLRTLELRARDGSQASDETLELLISMQETLILGSTVRLTVYEKQSEALIAQVKHLAELSAASLEDDETVASLRKDLAESLKEERGEARRVSEQEDWADLSPYHGEDSRSRDFCLHCGDELEDNRRAYCSMHCKDVHQSVFGVWEVESSPEEEDDS